ncbi:MAG: hypothetical protein GC160_05345 [Acidobacteria bacterium]|nr:hypothetical protein [Acidobacteriota bacterium]
MLDAVTLYASFDESLEADHALSSPHLRTRSGALDAPEAFRFVDGFDPAVYRVAEGAGVSGGALEATAVLPNFGRIFYPAAGNLPYREGGWGGAVSFWMRTNPDSMLRTPFCDPIQITQRGANNGGLWIDFPDSSPRDLRLGAFPSKGGRASYAETDPDAPLVIVEAVGFRETDWHHLAFCWSDFDSGLASARATLYIDGREQGAIEGREIAMEWDAARTGIYLAVNYIGLLDELAVFRRPLSPAEIRTLATEPAALTTLRRK